MLFESHTHTSTQKHVSSEVFISLDIDSDLFQTAQICRSICVSRNLNNYMDACVMLLRLSVIHKLCVCVYVCVW